jgi:hypothetical protein
MSDPQPLAAWLSFLSTLLWQLLLLFFVLVFRTEFKALLKRLAHLKVAQAELTFQPEAQDAQSPGGKAENQLKLVGHGGFLTRSGVSRLVEDSELVAASEKVVDQRLLFQTHLQRTWLVATNRNLFCILDDERTRSSGKLIQWRLPLETATPISTGVSKKGQGLVSIGPRRNWLYSMSLHPDADALVDQITELIEHGKKSV